MVADADEAAILRASASSYRQAWASHFGREHDPSLILGERNVFRYRPCRLVLVRSDLVRPEDRRELCQILLAARACGTPLAVSLPCGTAGWAWLARENVQVYLEDEERLSERLQSGRACERLRVYGPISGAVRAAAHRGHVDVVDAPVLANGRLELRWYLREQTVSWLTHRYGNVVDPPAAGTSW